VALVEHVIRDRVEADARLERRQRTTVELLDASGVAQYSQIGVPFLEANQEADLVLLRVRKPDGRELDLLEGAPRDVAPLLPPTLPIYSDLRLLRVAVPSLAVGDRLTFETLSRSKPLAKGLVWSEFAFTRDAAPEVHSYELDLPRGSPLRVHLRPGLDLELEEEESEERWVRRWRLAPTSPEKGTPAPDEKGFVADIELTSFASWEQFGRWFSDLAPPEIDRAVRAKAEALTKGLETPAARLRAVHRYVAQEIRYLALPLGMARFRARAPEEVMRTGLGDCKDKHRLLASLAAAAGIEIDTVLIHANGRRLVEAVPGPHHFDHLVSRARVDGRTIWLDTTSEMSPAGTLLANLRGVRALAVAGEGESARVELVTTPADPAVEATSHTTTTGWIDAAGLTRATVRWTFRGDEEPLRLAFKYGNEEVRRAVVEQHRSEWRDKAKIGAVRHSDPSALDEPFWFEYEVEYARSDVDWRKGWDFWIQVPRTWIVAPPEGEEQPDHVEFDGARRLARAARIEMPEGARATAPVPLALERSFASYRSDYRIEGRTLVVERELVRKVDRVPRAQFGELAAFRKLVTDDRNQEFDFVPAPELARSAETAEELESDGWDAFRADRYAEAEALFRRATELAPEHGSAWDSLGRSLYELGRLEEAGDALERQIGIDPHHDSAYASLARVFWKQGDHETAERYLRRQIEIAPLKAYSHRALGTLLLDRGEHAEAERMLDRARRLDPEDDDTVDDLVRLYAVTGRPEPAKALIRERGDLRFEDDYEAWLLGKMLFDGEEDGAWTPVRAWVERLEAHAAESLARLDPGTPSADLAQAGATVGTLWEAQGQIAIEAGRYAEATALLRAALLLNQHPRTARRLAVALRGSGDTASAALHLAVAKSIPGVDAEPIAAELAEIEPSLDRRRALERRAADEQLRLRSIVRKVAGAAKGEGRLLLAFDAAGRLRRAVALDGERSRALAAGLEREPPSVPVPPGGRLPPLFWADSYCQEGGECTLLVEPPMLTWRQLRQ